jgi:hypothetical protein
MIDTLLSRINKMRVYLGKKEYLADKEGAIQLHSFGYRDSESYFIKNGSGFKNTWDVSSHNGDYYNHQVVALSSQELTQVLEKLKDEHKFEVERKVKYELEVEAVRRRMVELGFSD